MYRAYASGGTTKLTRKIYAANRIAAYTSMDVWYPLETFEYR